MRASLLFLASASLMGCSLIIDSDEYVAGGPTVVGSCSVTECKAQNGPDFTCNARGECIDCDGDDDGYASLACLGLAGQELPQGDCNDSNASIYPDAFPTCGNGRVESCDFPSDLDDLGLEDVGLTPWIDVLGPTTPSTDAAGLELASTRDARWLLLGADASHLRLDRIHLAERFGSTIVVGTSGASTQEHFSFHAPPSEIRLLESTDGAYVAVAGLEPTPGTRMVQALYMNYSVSNPNDFEVAAIYPLFDGWTNPHYYRYADVLPGLITIPLPPSSQHAKLAIVGVREWSEDNGDIDPWTNALYAEAYRSTGITLKYDVPIEDEAPGTQGLLLSSGRFAAYLYTKTGGDLTLLLWRPDLDLTPGQGESTTYTVGPALDCYYRPELLALDGERVFFTYQRDDDCDPETPSPYYFYPYVEGFSCSAESGTCSNTGESYMLYIVSQNDPYDLTAIGGFVWFAYVDGYTNSVRLRAAPETPWLNPEIDYELLDLSTLREDLSVEDIAISSSAYEDESLNIGVAIRLRDEDGQVSTIFRSLRGCASH